LRYVLSSAFLGISHARVYFSETFGPGWEERWTQSTWHEGEHLQGKWASTTGKWFSNASEDQGIGTAEDLKFFSIAAPIAAFNVSDYAGKDLIIQYQVKHDKYVECAGGYIKLGPNFGDLTTFGNNTPYNIMFGPDKCGHESQTQLILTFAGEERTKKAKLKYVQESTGVSYLYTLTLRPGNYMRVEIDREKIFEGSLGLEWDHPVPWAITDLNDFQPEWWEEEEQVPDREDSKPDDWVEEEFIVDTERKRPDEECGDAWDDDEDGPWECSPSYKRLNPAYKGEWKQRQIRNQYYKGRWHPRQITAPGYRPENYIYNALNLGYIGIDLWQVTGGTIFDNLIITDDKNESDKFAAKWKRLRKVEDKDRKKEHKQLLKEQERNSKTKEQHEKEKKDEEEEAKHDLYFDRNEDHKPHEDDADHIDLQGPPKDVLDVEEGQEDEDSDVPRLEL